MAFSLQNTNQRYQTVIDMIQANSSTTNALLQRVTALDRSSERFSAQLAEAYDLVGISPESTSSYYSHVYAKEEARDGFGPKEEWVLRWLLKRMGEDVVNLGSPCLDPKSWILLRVMAARLPTMTTSRLLSTHKLTNTLAKTLHWLYGHVRTLTILSPESDPALPQSSLPSRESSSSATVQDVADPVRKYSRKRKRALTMGLDADEAATLIFEPPDVHALYLCMCSALSQVVTCSAPSSERLYGIAAEHMKAVLKSAVEQCGKILGCSLGVLQYIMKTDKYRSEDRTAIGGDIYESLLQPIVDLWSLRSTLVDDAIGFASARAFSATCLVPAAQLLADLVRTPHIQAAGVTRVRQTIEVLLVAHIILPGRAAFLRSKKWDPASKETSLSVIRELLKPLLETVHNDFISFPLSHEPMSLLAAIPFLYDTAMTCVEADTPKQRIAESPWQQALFVQFVNCAIFGFPVTGPTTQDKRCIQTLERMLRVAMMHNLVIDTSVLESIVLSLSGIEPDGFQDQINWPLISLCMEVNPNLVMIPRIQRSSTMSSLAHEVRTLDVIVANVSKLGFKEENQGSQDYEVMLRSIVLPLLQVAINARNMTAFVDIWKQQIAVWETFKALQIANGTIHEHASSIWVDEVLSQAVAEDVSSSAIHGQTLIILASLRSLSTSFSDSTESGVTELCADLVVLDCLVDGICKEDTAPALRSQLHQIVENLLSLVDNIIPEGYKWRVWRILATVVSRWPLTYSDSVASEVLSKRCIIAEQQLMEGISTNAQVPLTATAYDRILFGFGFLITASRAAECISPGVLTSGRLTPPVQVVVAGMKAHADNVRVVVEDDGHLPDSAAVWRCQTRSIKTRDQLVLACAALLASIPYLTRILQPSLVGRFLAQLYDCACRPAHSKKSMQDATNNGVFIDYAYVWETTLESGLLQENAEVARILRPVLLESFEGDAKEEQLTTGELDVQADMALPGLYRVSFSALTRDERNVVLQYISAALLHTNKPPGWYARNMTLLTHCLPYMKKSVDLLSNSSYLWELAVVLHSSSVTSNSHEALLAFQQLASKALGLVSQACIERGETDYLKSCEAIRRQFAANYAHRAPYTQLLLATILVDGLWSRWSELPTELKGAVTSITNMRHDTFDQLLDYLREPGNALDVWKKGPLLESVLFNLNLIEESTSVTVSTDAAAQASKLRTILVGNILDSVVADVATGEISENLDHETSYTAQDNLVMAKKISCRLWKDSQKDHQKFLLAQVISLSAFRTPRATRSWLKFLEKLYSESSLEDQAETLVSFGRHLYSRSADENIWKYLQKILTHSYESEARTLAVKSALAQLFSALCETTPTLNNTRCCILGLHCLDVLLKKSAWTISQWHIDNLLSTITIITSGSGPQTGSDSSDIYTCLTRLLGTVLTNHRSKLGGRYHLVVLALQGMLRCFFTPYTSDTDDGVAIERPPWLKTTKLGPEHAASYSRILTSISDPTVSAVTRSKDRARQELNDETKKARSIAGQHLQYLVMDFCRCQLQGRIEPGVRKALDPGLYAIFDAMSQEVMRTVNAALDKSGRAIFKVVYEDYRRFGKWKGA